MEPTKQQQILALGQLGWPVSRIATAVGVDRETVTRYVRAARLPVRQRGRPSEARAKPAISPEVSTDPPANPTISVAGVSTDPAPTRAPQASACEPHRDRIEAALKMGRNAMAIWQDLVDEVGFPARYASVRRFVQRLRGTAVPDARVVIVTTPGEDYGECRVMERCGGDRHLPVRLDARAGWRLPIIDYSDSSQVIRFCGKRPRRGVEGDPPALTRASRFISRSAWTYTSVDCRST